MASRFHDHWRSVLEYFALARPADGTPLPGAPRRSRYGLEVSPRIDQDIDDLRKRLEHLERRAR